MLEKRLSELRAQRAEVDRKIQEVEMQVRERNESITRLRNNMASIPEEFRKDINRLLAEFDIPQDKPAQATP